MWNDALAKDAERYACFQFRSGEQTGNHRPDMLKPNPAGFATIGEIMWSKSVYNNEDVDSGLKDFASKYVYGMAVPEAKLFNFSNQTCAGLRSYKCNHYVQVYSFDVLSDVFLV
jgi:hypothetical protein